MEGLQRDLVRAAIPPFEQKLRHTWSSLALFALPLPLLWLQLHLLVRYDPLRTLPLRLALIPAIAALTLPAAFGRFFALDGTGQITGQLQHFNFGAGVYSVYGIVRAIEWGTMVERPRLKRAGGSGDGGGDKGDGRSNGRRRGDQISVDGGDEPLPTLFPGSWTPVELDLLINMRGVGWESGTPLGAPALPVRRYSYGDRLRWAAGRLPNLLVTYAVLDALAVVLRDPRVFPSVATVPYTSIWTAPPGLFGATAGPYVLTAMFGSMVYLVIQSHHSLLAIAAVLLIGDVPSRWDPLPFNSPLSATSLQDLWSERWHHLFRQSFLHVGFAPTRKVVGAALGRKAGRAAAVMAVFAISALMHDWGQSTMVPPSPNPLRGWRPTQTGVFFLLEGVAVVLEGAWHDLTGCKVGGILGWLWTFTFLVVSGTMPTDEWTRRGLALSWVFTPKYTAPLVDRLVSLAVDYFA